MRWGGETTALPPNSDSHMLLSLGGQLFTAGISQTATWEVNVKKSTVDHLLKPTLLLCPTVLCCCLYFLCYSNVSTALLHYSCRTYCLMYCFTPLLLSVPGLFLSLPIPSFSGHGKKQCMELEMKILASDLLATSE